MHPRAQDSVSRRRRSLELRSTFLVTRRVLGGRNTAIILTLALVGAASGGRAAQNWPILRHDIQVAVEPAKSRLQATDAIDLGPPPNPTGPLALLLHKGLTVESIQLGKERLQFETAATFQPRHFWAKPDYERMQDYAAARELTVHPPATGWPATVRLELRYAGAIYDSLKPPKVAYERSFEETSGLIDARGVYLEGSTFWLPWSGEGLFRYRLTARVPAGWESMSQGTWAERRAAADGSVESLWVVETPMNEAYLVAGPYKVRKKEHGKVTAYTFTYAETPEDLCNTYLDATGTYLQMYEQMLGPYPFDKFALVENWWQTGYGMPSFTLLGDRVIRLPFIVHTSYGHEILHNWWGNGVFVAEGKGNWSEGLTSYLADYTYKEREGEAAARDYRLSQLQGYLDYASSGGRDFALRRFTERESPATQAVGYGKTMMVFHMARKLWGDAVFFTALQHFYKEKLFQEASWDDLVRSFAVTVEADGAPGGAAGAAPPLVTPWFEQWIGRPGAPVLSVSRGPASAGGPRLEIRQAEPFYDLRVPIRYELGGEMRSREVELRSASATIQLEPGARWVAVDPDMELFRKLHRAEIPPALSHVLGADSTFVVIGSRCTPEMAAALRALASTWSHNHDQVLVDERDFRRTVGRGVWLFGEGDLVDRCFASSGAFGDAPLKLRTAASTAGRSLVACFRDAEREEIAWTVVLPATPAVVEALGKKLPHYGRYSYLAFEGETNVDKGNWQVQSSPLRLDLTP